MSEGNGPGTGARTPQGQDLQRNLARTRLAADLQNVMAPPRRAARARPLAPEAETFPVIIEANARYRGGSKRARLELARAFVQARPGAVREEVLEDLRSRGFDLTAAPAAPFEGFGEGDEIDLANSFWTHHHLIARLRRGTLQDLAARDWGGEAETPIYKIWLNHAVRSTVFESVRTVKCDAARAAFFATGEGVVWAVADTGIDGAHPHFRTHATLELEDGLEHHDFTGPDQPRSPGEPHPALTDSDGHGTHVAGIIAGETRADPADGPKRRLLVSQDVLADGDQTEHRVDEKRAVIAGLAPACKLVSLKVLADRRSGDVGRLLAALGYIHAANSNGATEGDLRIHGVNLSLGYSFDARWFAAGQSPVCVEVNRLVRSGVVVVVAAGNGGYGTVQSLDRSVERASHLGTIDDPGNAELAITVGSTHRDKPHTYGVSYFSGKGPTADGRSKPDVVAPGERIVSCALTSRAAAMAEAAESAAEAGDAPFCEMSGTSMAAPHVSGVVAAFLSVRREFRGQPDRVKEILRASATDLGRRPEFQGAGLVDAMRALQMV